MMTDLNRDKRDIAGQSGTCPGQFSRDGRDTPLGGVTVVPLVRTAAEMVPMPPFVNGCVTARLTVPFSLPKKSGENAHG